MKPKMILRIAVDFLMTVILILLMMYQRIGSAVHEWIGVAMFVLFIVHHIINRNWIKNLFRGRYTLFRILQTLLVFLVLLCMLGSMISGIMISRHVFAFLPIHGGRSFARILHMFCAYWGYICMALHLGLHWSIITGMAGKCMKKPSAARKIVLRSLAVLLAVYGLYEFVQRDIISYMLLQNQFVFFDFAEPVILFLADYVAIMGLFVLTGHCLASAVQKSSQRRK